MAAPNVLYDVWIVRLDRVYQGVPFDVVTNWLQQGQLLADDKVRAGRSTAWSRTRDIPALAAFLPKPAAHTIGDRAEALEPVELGFHYRQPDDDESDVDMVPLIDISLVLLIFFMMTSTVAIGGGAIDVPETKFATLTSDASMLWIGVDRGPAGATVYSIGEGSSPPKPDDQGLDETTVLERLKQRLRNRPEGKSYIVRVAGLKTLPFETMQKLTIALNQLRPMGISDVKAEVSEKPR